MAKFAILQLIYYLGIVVFADQILEDDYGESEDVVHIYPVKSLNSQVTGFKFEAFGKHFALELFPSSSTHINQISGRVVGENDSEVQGSIGINGEFQGFIQISNKMYYIEPISGITTNKTSLESTIYLLPAVLASFIQSELHFNNPPSLSSEENYSLQTRQRRKVGGKMLKKSRQAEPTVCSVKITIDHTMYQAFTHRSKDDIIKWVMETMNFVDNVYRNVDFDMDGKPDGIRLWVKEVKVWRSIDEPGYLLYKKQPETAMGAACNLLAFNKENASHVCVSLLFTARSFGLNMGIAFLRSNVEGEITGICSNYHSVMITMFNEGWNTVMTNYFALADFQARRALEQTIIHEIGHSFGAPHDEPNMTHLGCYPSDKKGGLYIMVGHAFNEFSSNSLKFSPCSLREIKKKFEKFGKDCFEYEDGFPHCGNAFIDAPNEECDCGKKEQCDKIDPCCTPRGGALVDKECTYRRHEGAVCSYREDKCCTTSCSLVPAKLKRQCNAEDICKKPSFCNGQSKDCPSSDNLRDGTICRSGLGKCQNGTCEDVICRSAKLLPCKCAVFRHICKLCCSKKGTCLPASVWGIGGRLYEDEDEYYYEDEYEDDQYNLPNGEPCYIDVGSCKDGRCNADILRSLNDVEVPGIKRKVKHSHDKEFGYLVLIVLAFNVAVIVLLVVVFVVYKKYYRRSVPQTVGTTN